jgi:putative DNA methylase
MTTRKKLIEVALPLDDINMACQKEKYNPFLKGHPRSMHHWWARRPLAAARAVIFSQMVDDPSSFAELSKDEVIKERERLFGIIRDLVKWENANNEDVLNRARVEIKESWARTCKETGEDPDKLPPFHDPFAGGGTLPLEAQRLGFESHASDLNPVAVMINKAMIEIPPKFAGNAPIHPRQEKKLHDSWSGAEGLAEDVIYYGEWMCKKSLEKIGHLYPEVDLPEDHGGGKATVVAWLWARTVESPNPAFKGVHVPLISNFFVSTKKGKEAWIDPIVEGREYRFEIRYGKPEDPATVKSGTKTGRGANFNCLVSGSPIPPIYIKAEGVAGRMGKRLMAVVAEGNRSRIYLPPTESMQSLAESAKPIWSPEEELNYDPRAIWCPAYGQTTYAHLFTNRQLVALATFSELVMEARNQSIADAKAAGMKDDGVGVADGGSGATAYGDALAVYLGLSVSTYVGYSSVNTIWNITNQNMAYMFSRQAIPMTWDFPEANPIQGRFSIEGSFRRMSAGLSNLGCWTSGKSEQLDAGKLTTSSPCIISTDPPYYDNIGYADLSDVFYVWLRKSLNVVYPELFSTLLVPKAEELVASPYRHGGKSGAEDFFLDGMTAVMTRLSTSHHPSFPIAIYYAFKQSEKAEAGTSSTGWETFLQAVVDSGLSIQGTWPVRAERPTGLKKQVNALATCVVLVCVRREESAPVTTRSDFVRLLRQELPMALEALKQASIAPVDMAQAAIGPGMAIFSRFSQVMENDGSAMPVQSALQLINKALDDTLSKDEGDYDSWTGFAVSWFEQHGMDGGDFGIADNLARARGISVSGVVDAGIAESKIGKVRLLDREELDPDWDPATDDRLTVWEALQYLIRSLNDAGESGAADLLRRLGAIGQEAHNLAYRLYSICEQKGWSEEATHYNGIIVAWPTLNELAQAQPATPTLEQSTFTDE